MQRQPLFAPVVCIDQKCSIADAVQQNCTVSGLGTCQRLTDLPAKGTH